MKIGIIGLGLIGGSLVKTIKQKTEHIVYGWDFQETICMKAQEEGIVDGILNKGEPSDCDMILIALYPKLVIDYMKKYADSFQKGTYVLDCAGVKERICEEIEPITQVHKFLFCGAHPMAGIEKSGLSHSTGDLFEKASMILTPYESTAESDITFLSEFFLSIGFGQIQIATPREHDEFIAYTSQLAHVVSSAYIKEDVTGNFKGFSAGSFRDMTRVAKLNEDMWTELFLENNEFLADEIDDLIVRLEVYSHAIREKEEINLRALLKQGKEKRLKIDQNQEQNKKEGT